MAVIQGNHVQIPDFFPIRNIDEIRRKTLEICDLFFNEPEKSFPLVHQLVENMDLIGVDIEVGMRLKSIALKYPNQVDERYYQTLRRLANELTNDKKYQEAIDLLESLENEACVEQLKELKAFCQSSPKPLYQLAQTIDAHSSDILGITAIDNEFVASGSLNGELKVLNLRAGDVKILRSEGAYPLPKTITYLPHENTLVCNGMPGNIEFWNPVDGSCEIVKSSQMYTSVLARLDASRTYAPLASGSRTGCIDFWKFTSTIPQKPQIWKTADGPYVSINCITEIGVGKIVAGSSDCTAKIWDFISGDFPIVLHTLKHNSAVIEALSLPGELIATADSSHYIKIWNRKTGELLTDLRGIGSSPRLLLNPRVNWIVTTANNSSGDSNNAIQISDFSTHRTVANFKGHTDTPISVVTVIENLTAKYLVSGSALGDGSIKVWDLTTNMLIQTLEGHPGHNVMLLLFQSNLVSAGSDGKIKVWSRI